MNKTINISMILLLFIILTGCSTVKIQVVTDKSHWHIQPQFEEASDFNEGLALVKKFGRYCFIDKEGRIVIKTRYIIEHSFSEGMAIVSEYIEISRGKSEKRYGYINKDGICVIKPQFIEAYDFKDGHARVRIYDEKIKEKIEISNYKKKTSVTWEPIKKWCYINKEGKIVIETDFSEAEDFHDGIAKVGRRYNISANKLISTNNLYGYIDLNGKMIIDPEFSFSGHFYEGLAFATLDIGYEKKFGYINNKGSFVIQPVYSEAGDFTDGIAIVKNDSGCFYINNSGKILFECPQGNSDNDFCDGLAVSVLAGQYGGHGYDYYEGVVEYRELDRMGFVDKKNKLIIARKYAMVKDFSEGLAKVLELSGRCGYIDKKGNMILELMLPGISNTAGELKNIIYKNGILFYSDSKNNLVKIGMNENTGDFHDGLARVKLNNRWGYIKRPDK